ncbi:SAM dependent carboxyl methyltransferase - like 10 [Theobroma cacao]|nr:SAM dependent carboxyl methyltransferase - like 10 [Theobroma cacao]
MEVKDMVFMNKGDGENSYVQSAGLTDKLAAVAQPMVYKVVESVLKEKFCSSPGEVLFNVADLGCSSGPNTFTVMSTVLESVAKNCGGSECQMSEIQFYLNDLVGNDFNTLFKGVPSGTRTD